MNALTNTSSRVPVGSTLSTGGRPGGSTTSVSQPRQGALEWTKYRPCPGRLFGLQGPRVSDVREARHNVADCYFMAALASVAHAAPHRLASGIQPLGADTYKVTFFNTHESRAEITVDNKLPTDVFGRLVYARPAADPTTGENILWPALYEKAFAVFKTQQLGRRQRFWRGGYGAIGLGGRAESALLAITGAPASCYSVAKNQAVLTDILVAAARRPVVLNTRFDMNMLASGLQPRHSYTFLGLESGADGGPLQIRVRDPVCSRENNGGFRITYDQLSRWVEHIVVGAEDNGVTPASSV